MKVLISAYACKPGCGSEQEVGWQWSLQAARSCAVTVLTRAKHRPNIQEGLRNLGHRPQPTFRYYEVPGWASKLRRALHLTHWGAYVLWQQLARREVARLLTQERYDLLHHLTWGEMRSWPATWGHRVKWIWGPVNGLEPMPLGLMPWEYPREIFHESCRMLANTLTGCTLDSKARAADLILVSTGETQRALEARGWKATLMPEIGLERRPHLPRSVPTGSLRLLFEGRLVFHKGIHLGIRALAASGTTATLRVVGNGNFQAKLQTTARQLGVADRVFFEPSVPYRSLLQLHRDHDVFVFPDINESGTISVIEAMGSGLPVICLRSGGPALSVAPGCGFQIPVGPADRVVQGLAEAIRHYDDNRSLLLEHGQRAWQNAMEHFCWDKKGSQLAAFYRQTCDAS